jgi:hypothetical protein
MRYRSIRTALALLTLIVAAAACAPSQEPVPSAPASGPESDISERLARYTQVELGADLSGLSDGQRQMVGLLIEAAQEIDGIYWQQAYGDPAELLASAGDPDTLRLVELNFGPWDRIRGNEPFLAGFPAKPAGANFYPADVTTEEIEAAGDPSLTDLYTIVRRDEDGRLFATPYHEAFAARTEIIAEKLEAAAALAEDPEFRHYLELRADALRADDYQASDFAWMDTKNNAVEVVIGPIETYEDQLLGAKATHEAYVLLKDRAWSERLSRYAAFLPGLQRSLPVDDRYKAETPGTDADLNAYDVLYVGGDANAGSKTIAINLPNDPEVQLQKGTRRLQLKNVMRAKFDSILVPIATELIVPEQREHVTFDAFFANTMFHEVAHGLGVKNTLDGAGTVREAMLEQASWLEEGKADVLGLHMITQLHEQGELGDADLMDNYVTFVASIFRSVRFGPTSAHARANLVRFSLFREMGAFTLDEETGYYTIHVDRLQEAMRSLSERILVLQGDGDRAGAAALYDQAGIIGPELQAALDRLADRSIPVDLIYRQGTGELRGSED